MMNEISSSIRATMRQRPSFSPSILSTKPRLVLSSSLFPPVENRFSLEAHHPIEGFDSPVLVTQRS
ncbi:hypothetical protein Lser_V15G17038 [Lactuca serriola]